MFKNSLYLCMIVCFPLFALCQEPLDVTTKTNRQTLSKVLEGDFNRFFNLEEKARIALSPEEMNIHYKTGGFQEYIDIYLVMNKDQRLLSSKLIVSREWMKGANLKFAIDIIKSFVLEFSIDKEHIQPLADKLWNFGTDMEPELTDENLIGCFDVFQGKTMSYTFNYKDQGFVFNNKKGESGVYVFVVEVN